MTEEVKPKKGEQKQAKIFVEPVHGWMINMLTGQVISGITEVKEIDFWLQAQIDAGKLNLV